MVTWTLKGLQKEQQRAESELLITMTADHFQPTNCAANNVLPAVAHASPH